MTIVQTLRADPERACGTFPVEVAPSTLTHHFRVLREAGVIRQREDGNRRWTTLRLDDLQARFPGPGYHHGFLRSDGRGARSALIVAGQPSCTVGGGAVTADAADFVPPGVARLAVKRGSHHSRPDLSWAVRQVPLSHGESGPSRSQPGWGGHRQVRRSRLSTAPLSVHRCQAFWPYHIRFLDRPGLVDNPVRPRARIQGGVVTRCAQREDLVRGRDARAAVHGDGDAVRYPERAESGAELGGRAKHTVVADMVRGWCAHRTGDPLRAKTRSGRDTPREAAGRCGYAVAGGPRTLSSLRSAELITSCSATRCEASR